MCLLFSLLKGVAEQGLRPQARIHASTVHVVAACPATPGHGYRNCSPRIEADDLTDFGIKEARGARR